MFSFELIVHSHFEKGQEESQQFSTFPVQNSISKLKPFLRSKMHFRKYKTSEENKVCEVMQ